LVQATVWDVIPYVLFESSYCGTTYSKRIESLSLMIQKHKPTKVKLVQSDLVESLDIAQSMFETYLADGQEGIILKGADGAWEDKRSKSQIKFKGELECDLKIVAIEMGNGKYAGMLGAIICESADGVIKVRVGSGFNDEQRQTLGDEIIGKIAAVKYNVRTTNKQGEESLFLPIVLEIRDDKTEADSSDAIK